MVVWRVAGLPGPLERKSASLSFISGWSGVSHGTRVTCTSRWTSERMMFALMPQSTARTFIVLPLPYTFVTVVETSAARLRSFGSSSAGGAAPGRVTAPSNSIRARSAPFSRIFFVRSRVSRP